MKVALDYKNQDGYACYDETAKTIEIVLEDEAKRLEVISFLDQPHLIAVPGAKCNEPYINRTVEAKNSREDFELALSRLWEKTEVLVQWSRRIA